jgi:hypothetical protein
MGPSIMLYAVVLALVRLVCAQNRRLVTNFGMDAYMDLVSTDMSTAAATAFINNTCRDVTDVVVLGALNVQTYESMKFEDFKESPEALGKAKYNYALYPWSVVKGTCNPLFTSTWITDREVVNGPKVDNTESRAWRLKVPIEVVDPKTNITTTLEGWKRHATTPDFAKHFFENAKTPDAVYLVNSMGWNEDNEEINIITRADVPACTQVWCTSVSVVRTMIAVNTFWIEEYSWGFRRKDFFGRMKTVGGASTTWMDVSLSANNKKIKAVPKGGDQWKGVYSSAGWVRAEGVAWLLPGTTRYLDHLRQPLPPQQCLA